MNRHLSKGWTLIAWDVDGGNAVFLLGWEGAEDPPKDDDAGDRRL